MTAREPQGRHIAVAEDDGLHRELVSAMLRRAGHRVNAVDGGDSCLALLAGRPFDLLVTDLFMPTGDGMSLLVALRDRGITIPVIGMTGGCSGMVRPYADAMLSLGAETVLAKPFTSEELLAAVAARAGALS